MYISYLYNIFSSSVISILFCIYNFLLLKIHRGNLNEYAKNIENKKSNKTPANAKTTTTTTVHQQSNLSSHQNEHISSIKKFAISSDDDNNKESNELTSLSKRDIIRKFDAKYKTDSEKETVVSNKNRLSFIESKDVDCNPDSPQEDSTGSSEEVSSESPQQQHSGGDSGFNSPPKPMPRTSRNNSLPDATTTTTTTPPINTPGSVSMEDNSMPRPRPRTTAASTYKV